MSENNTIKVNIELGEGYQPTPRIAAAIDELDAALREAHDQEVSGYMQDFHFSKANPYILKLDTQWSPLAGLTTTKELCTNENLTED